MRYRVLFAKRTYVELYLDVEADSKDEAAMKAAKATEDGDDLLVEMPDTYSGSTESTGEINEIEGDDDKDTGHV